MFKFKLLALLLIMFSCKSLDKPLSYYNGEYKFQDEIATGKLTLQGDNRFKFSYSAHLLKVHSEGKWYLEKNRIFLISDEDYKNDYMIVKEIESSSDLNYIEIVNQDNLPLNDLEVKICDTFYITDKFGRIYIDNCKDFDTIRLYYIGLSEEKSIYKLKNKNKSFSIRVIEKEYDKIYFNDSFKIRNNFVLIRRFKYVKY